MRAKGRETHIGIRALSVGAAFLFGVGVLLAGANEGRANLILNGDFATSVPTNGTGGNWTSSNNDGAGGWRSSGGSFNQHFILNQSGQAATDPTIEQLVNGFVIGESFSITGDVESFASGFGNPAALSFGVEIVGVLLQEFTRNQVSPGNAAGSFSVSFVATATSHTLRLTGERNSDDSSYRIDNIAINKETISIPEPSTLPLFGAGLALIGFSLWRRKKAA